MEKSKKGGLIGGLVASLAIAALPILAGCERKAPALTSGQTAVQQVDRLDVLTEAQGKEVIADYLSGNGLYATTYPGNMAHPIRHYHEGNTGSFGTDVIANGGIFVNYGVSPGIRGAAEARVLRENEKTGGISIVIQEGSYSDVLRQLDQQTK
jgi:hypothetical protein